LLTVTPAVLVIVPSAVTRTGIVTVTLSPTASDATCSVMLVASAMSVPLLVVTGANRVTLTGKVSVTVAPTAVAVPVLLMVRV